jgi:hypothetical protein
LKMARRLRVSSWGESGHGHLNLVDVPFLPGAAVEPHPAVVEPGVPRP